MALVDLLYRCPRCGHDPLEGRGDDARCPGCRTAFRRRGARIAVQEADAGPGGWADGVDTAELVEALEGHGGPLSPARTGDGFRYSAPSLHHGPLSQRPVRQGGRLLGYVEVAGEGSPGLLEVTGDALTFLPEGGAGPWTRPLEEVTALQLASRALQIGMGREGTFQWTLLHDSPFRWESLLQALLRRRWSALGRGEIVEFQPRVRTSGEGR